MESNCKRKIRAEYRLSRFSYLNFLNTFMGVLCLSYSLPKMLHAVVLFLLNSLHAVVVNGNVNMERNPFMLVLISVRHFEMPGKERNPRYSKCF